MWGIKGKETVTILKSIEGVEDEYGNAVETFIPIEIKGCLVAQNGASVVSSLFKDGMIYDIEIHFPKGTEVSKNDLLLYRNEKYTVASPPVVWEGPVGSPIPTIVLVGGNYEE